MSIVNTIQKLEDVRGKLWNEIQGMRDDLAEGKFTPEMDEKFDKMNSQYVRIESEIRNLEEAEKRDIQNAGREVIVAGVPVSAKTQSEKYQDSFRKWAGGTPLTDAEKAVMQSYQNAAQQTISTTGGGYIIPEGFAGEVVKSMLYYGPFGVAPGAGPARVINTKSGNPFPIPTINDTGNSGQSLAINTDATTSSTALTFGTAQLDAYVITADVIQVPKQLIQDEGVDFPSLLAEFMGERMGRRYNNKVTRGTGSSEPQGFEDKATQGKLSASPTAITGNELVDLQHSVDRAYRNGPSVGWMMHDSIAAAIRKLTVTSSADQYLWQPNFQAGQADRMLGNLVYINNDLDSTLASDTRPVFFGDWSKFWIRIVKGMEMTILHERFAEKYQVGWMGTMRFDSELVDTAAIKFIRQITT